MKFGYLWITIHLITYLLTFQFIAAKRGRRPTIRGKPARDRVAPPTYSPGSQSLIIVNNGISVPQTCVPSCSSPCSATEYCYNECSYRYGWNGVSKCVSFVKDSPDSCKGKVCADDQYCGQKMPMGGGWVNACVSLKKSVACGRTSNAGSAFFPCPSDQKCAGMHHGICPDGQSCVARNHEWRCVQEADNSTDSSPTNVIYATITLDL